MEHNQAQPVQMSCGSKELNTLLLTKIMIKTESVGAQRQCFGYPLLL